MVAQGEVWWADLPDPTGSGQGFRRPVVVLQGDALNRSRLTTAVCVRLTSNLRWAEAPGSLLLRARSTGRGKDSVANLSQIITIDRTLLSERVGRVSRTGLGLLFTGLDLVLGRSRGLRRALGRNGREGVVPDVGAESVASHHRSACRSVSTSRAQATTKLTTPVRAFKLASRSAATREKVPCRPWHGSPFRGLAPPEHRCALLEEGARALLGILRRHHRHAVGLLDRERVLLGHRFGLA